MWVAKISGREVIFETFKSRDILKITYLWLNIRLNMYMYSVSVADFSYIALV